MKRLVLAGGGHAHLQVLGALARAPLAGWQVELVTPHPSVIYSGMLPGWLAGHYTLDQCTIDLRPLAARAGVALHAGSIRALDAGARMLALEDGTARGFDLLSLNTGSAPADPSSSTWWRTAPTRCSPAPPGRASPSSSAPWWPASPPASTPTASSSC